MIFLRAKPLSNHIHQQTLIPAALDQARLDQALSELLPQYSRAQIQKWIKAGKVKLDGEIIHKNRHLVHENQTVTIQAELETQHSWEAQAITLDVIHEDEDTIIINKPAGLVVHPGAGNSDHTLANALLHFDPELKLLPRHGIIHRLDKDTSGIMIIARNIESYHYLVKALQAREIQRTYLAIVKGVVKFAGNVDAPIGRHPQARTKMAVHPLGKVARTHYEILENFPQFTYLKLRLETGRTHQIRVHMNHIHHPLVGDPVYGQRIHVKGALTDKVRESILGFNRQALHATQLDLLHPRTQQALSFQVPLPIDMESLLEVLRDDRNHRS